MGRKIKKLIRRKDVSKEDENQSEEEISTKPVSKPMRKNDRARVVDNSSEDGDISDEGTAATPPSPRKRITTPRKVEEISTKDSDPESSNEVGEQVREESNGGLADVANKKKSQKKVTKKKSKGKKEEFEVDQIVGMDINHRWSCPIRFLVRWVGYGEKDDSWIPLHNLSCDTFILDFLQISGRKPEYDKAMEKFLKPVSQEGYTNLRKSSRPNYNESDSDEEILTTSSTRTRKIRGPAVFNPVDARPQQLKRSKTNRSSGSARQNGHSVISRAEANRDQAGREYEVALIVDHRVKGRFTEYKVRWKGLPSAQDSWVPEANLNCPQMVKSYHKTVSSKEESEYEVSAIIDSREIDGEISYKVRWKGFAAKYDSWLPKDEMDCPDLVEKFEKALEKLNQKEDWVVSKIRGRRVKNDEVQYLVHWSGFESKHDTWEPEENLSACQDKVDDFLAKLKTKNLRHSDAEDKQVEGKRGRAEGGGGDVKRRRLRQKLQVSYSDDGDSDF